jgi:two-component system, sensor histidine kinase and response regulator
MTTTIPPPLREANRPRGSLRPALDPRKLHELEALKPSVRSRVLAAYRRDAPTVMSAIEAALDGGAAAGVRDGAHRLKSSSAAIGATQLAELYAELERMGRAGALKEAGPLMRQLRAELMRVLRSLSGVGAG